MNASGKCPVCGSPAQIGGTYETLRVRCLRCGSFAITELTSIVLHNASLTPQQVANTAGWLREHPDVVIGEKELLFLKDLRSPTVGDKATKLLVALSERYPDPGAIIQVWSCDLASIGTGADNPNTPPPADRSTLLRDYLYLVGAAWIKSQSEFDYLVGNYLSGSRKFLEDIKDHHRGHRITPDGWAFLDELQRANPSSRVGFIAMWFHKDLDPVHLAIESGIRAAGYDPKRIDRVEHNNRIDDEIIAWIRRSKFVVAEMTGNRGGVYFESGYALGMGLQVIWLCREDELPNVHFDNRQYNFIVWSPDRLSELTQRLQNRIEATIGRPA
jgi:nucleoside 2-deoxyribosyltransferase